MKRTAAIVSLVVLVTAGVASAKTVEPEKAQVILAAALKKAETSNKTVFLIFHASWCDWCSRLDAVLESPDVKDVIDENYVVARIDVMEFGENQNALENPGGREMMERLGGATSALPFYAFLDSRGRKLADSNVMAFKPSAKAGIANVR